MDDSTQKIPLIVGIAAQHDLPGEYTGLLEQRLVALLKGLRKSYPHTPVRVMCTLQRGAAMLCAHAAIEAGCELVAALPLEAEEYSEEFGEGEAREEFTALLAQAAEAFAVPVYEEAPPPEDKPDAVELDQFGEVEKQIPRSYYYRQAGIYIAKHSHMVVSLWDGRKLPDEERANDFTLHTTLLAHEQPFSKMAGGGELQNNGVVLQITTPIIRAPRLPDPLPLQTRLFRGEQELRIRHNRIHLREFALLDTYNRDAARHAGLIARKLDGAQAVYLDQEYAQHLPDVDRSLLVVLAQADILAGYYQRLRMYMQYGLGLAGLLFVLVALLGQPPGSPLLLAVYAVLAGMAVLALSMTGRRRYAGKYVRYRLLSQFLCLQFYMEVANIRDYFMRIPWWQRSSEVSFAERAAMAFRRTEWNSTLRYNLDLIYRHWVVGEHFHYRYEAEQKERRANRYHRLAFFALLAAIAAFFVVDNIALQSPDFRTFYDQSPALTVLVRCVLCAIAAAVSYLIYYSGALFDDDRLKYSVKMYRSLTVAGKRLRTARESYDRRAILSLLLLIANTQVMEALGWYTYHARREKRPAQQRRRIPKELFWVPKHMRKRKLYQ